MKYRKEIDGLRAVAVLPVIFFHAGFKAFGGGFVGVDVFFVISGYLITTIILSDMNQGKFSIVSFYERRARRILPALFFLMLCCLPFAWIWLTPQHLMDFCQSLTAVSFFSSNILFWRESGYFGVASELKPLIHTWSLSVEEQYYVFFPLFLMVLWKLRKRWIFGALVIVCAASLILSQWGAYHNPSETFYFLPTRLWELAIGALIAFYFLYNRSHLDFINSKKRSSEFFGFLGLSMILCSVFLFDSSTPFPSFYALMPTVGAGLVIVFATEQTVVGRILSARVMVGVGLISYSLYLWHLPFLVFSRHESFCKQSISVVLLLLFLSIVFAYISWRYVETPFRNKKVVSRKAIFSFAFVGSFFFASIGLAGHYTHGFYNLKVDDVKDKLLKTINFSPKRKACHTRKGNYIAPEDSCVYNVSDASWATFGDSHAVELAYALANHLEKQNVGVKHFSFSGCAPSYGRSDDENLCTKWTNEAVECIVSDKNIKNVVVTYRVNAYLSRDHANSYPEIPPLKDKDEVKRIIDGYVDVVNKFCESGKNVILVMQAPELPADVERLILMSKPGEKDVKGVSAGWWNRRNGYFVSQLDKFNSDVKIIDPKEVLCDSNNCYATLDGVSMYFDDDHLSIYGAGKIVEKIFETNE